MWLARAFPACLSPLRALPAAPAGTAEDIPAGKDEDLRVFYPHGRTVRGEAALALMSGGRTDLNIFLAGNQFFAMADVIHAFRQGRPATVAGLITLPPGKALGAALKGGWRYRGRDYRLIPDVIGQVDMGSLRRLKAAAMASEYIAYMHNELVLMVAAGNPRGISGIDDLGRGDLRRILPNPLTEGIMTFYAKPVLEAHGLWHGLTHGTECQACAPVPNVYFTAVHHREIPAAIQAGNADVGIVWATEGRHAREQGAQIDIVRLPAGDSRIDDIVYVASPLDHAPHPAAAAQYVAFLGSEVAQAAYARHGFVKAGDKERIVREIR